LATFRPRKTAVLMYTSGAAASTQLTWFDRTGKKVDTAGSAWRSARVSLSPDDTTVVFARRDPQAERYDLWMQDLVHSRESRLTFTGSHRFPVWSADGKHVFFVRDRDGPGECTKKPYLAVHLTHVAPTACGLGVGGLSGTDTSLAKGTGAVLTACSRRR
jgi:hypothetical protein